MQKDFEGDSSASLGFDAERTAVLAKEWPDGVTSTERLATGSTIELALCLADGSTMRLGDRAMTVGRSAACDLTLLDRSVSALHALVLPCETGWEIRDENSTNGTWIDGVRVSSAKLRPGIELAFGRVVVRCVQRQKSAAPVAVEPAREAVGSDALFGSSEAMRAVQRDVAFAARTPYSVLIRGESGSGKELVAHAIHQQSAMSGAPFVALNAGAIPESLVESELFGHERGAFTGANARRRGAFEQAHNGVLFLDEVGELPLAQQAKLLRVLETHEIRRVGSETAVKVSVKLVCATHRDLRALAREGRFREDLLWRIEQHSVLVPPLRERMEDLPALAQKLCQRISLELGRTLVLEHRAVVRLLAYDWPGNVRELLAVLRSAAARAPDVRIGEEHLGAFEERAKVLSRRTDPPPALAAFEDAVNAERVAATKLPVPDGEALLALLGTLGGSLSALSRATGRSRAALRERVRKAQAERSQGVSLADRSTPRGVMISARTFSDDDNE
ncbi:MAG: sigma 54-interacting transcriptional regulator [Polyangiales bacterium]